MSAVDIPKVIEVALTRQPIEDRRTVSLILLCSYIIVLRVPVDNAGPLPYSNPPLVCLPTPIQEPLCPYISPLRRQEPTPVNAHSMISHISQLLVATPYLRFDTRMKTISHKQRIVRRLRKVEA